MPDLGRALAVDLGTKRIGLAIGDPTGLVATALPFVAARGPRKDVEAIAAVAAAEDAATIVVGLPLSMNGQSGPMADKARAFGASLAALSGREVVFWDERLTTSEALRRMREGGVRRDKRAATVDSAAAAILLQSYLDARRMRQ